MAPKIEDYSFGRIVIDGKEFKQDVIVLPGRVMESWWRKDGHSLDPSDLAEALAEVKPDTLIVGCGKNDLLKVPDRTREWIEDKGIKLVALPTGEAVERYNQLAWSQVVMAGLHLTC